MTKEEKAYQTVCKVLGVKPAKITENIPTSDEATLVIVPNQVFSWLKIKKLAKYFGGGQPYEAYVHNELYKKYSDVELSGRVVDDKPYRYLYIPKQYNVASDTPENQAKAHAKDHVPSVLEAICFWFTLRELGENLDFDSTYIRHFDLQQQTLDGWSVVPYSYVYNGGWPYLTGAEADDRRGARVAVGSTSSFAPSLESFPSADLQANTEAVRELTETLKKVYRV